jgi:ADP-ribose pyrophosphatase YjhB (NUDIX family)
MGEPGKDAVSKRKDDKFNIPFEKMPIQKLGGAVVYAKDKGVIYFALVHDVFGHWTLSKGKIGDNPDIANESVEEGTIREIKEEIGVDIVIKERLANNEYVATHPEKGKMRKQVVYFLAETEYKPLKLGESGGLDKAQWFPLDALADLNFYDDMLPIITKAVGIVSRSASDTSKPAKSIKPKSKK